jgi:hypothetical protein
VVAHAFSTPYTEVSAILGIGLAAVWLQLLFTGVMELSEYVALTFTGHLRRRPDPAFERTLREAFAELDAELSAVLADSSGSRPRG